MTHKTFARHVLGMAVAVVLALQFSTSPARADDNDTLKAVVGVAALALIANHARSQRLKREAAAQSARNAIEQEINRTRVCQSANWTGRVWVEANGQPCLPTPKVCLRERWRGDFLVKYFDTDCMKREGFRLTQSY